LAPNRKINVCRAAYRPSKVKNDYTTGFSNWEVIDDATKNTLRMRYRNHFSVGSLHIKGNTGDIVHHQF
jgi:hypothetical protein